MPELLVYFATLIGTLALIGAMVGWSMRRERARSEALRGVADRLGLTFHADESEVRPWIDAHLGGSPWFIRGDGGRVENLMFGGLEGRQVAVLESDFFHGSGRSRNDYQQTVVVLGAADQPWFALHPRSWRTGIIRTLYLAADTELVGAGAAGVATHYRAYGAEHEALRARLSGPASACLGARPGWWIEARGTFVFACRLGVRPKPEQLRAHVLEAIAVLEQVALNEGDGGAGGG